MKNVDCSKCKNCYPHQDMWGEFWCEIKASKQKDGYVYDLHNLKGRFKEECRDFQPRK